MVVILGSVPSLFVYAKLEDHVNRRSFYLEPHEIRVFEEVDFCTKKGFTAMKIDKLLPWIIVCDDGVGER